MSYNTNMPKEWKIISEQLVTSYPGSGVSFSASSGMQKDPNPDKAQAFINSLPSNCRGIQMTGDVWNPIHVLVQCWGWTDSD